MRAILFRLLTVKHLLRTGICLLFVYAIILLVLMAYEDQLVFRPAAAAHEWQPPSAACHVEDVFFRTEDGTSIHGWWCPGANTNGVALICHGNSHNISTIRETHPDKLAQWRSELGMSVLIFDYPGYGKSDGEPNEEGCYAAAHAAFDWLIQERKYAAKDILIVGKSLGTAVAVELASSHPHRALVLISPFTSIPDVAEACYPLLSARLLMHNRFDSLSRIGDCKRPVLIFHGTCDRRVPFHLGKQLFEAANEPKRFVRMDGAHHGSSVVVRFFPEVKRFLAEMAKVE